MATEGQGGESERQVTNEQIEWCIGKLRWGSGPDRVRMSTDFSHDECEWMLEMLNLLRDGWENVTPGRFPSLGDHLHSGFNADYSEQRGGDDIAQPEEEAPGRESDVEVTGHPA